MAGIFLSLDGPDGAGKSTQLDRLARWLVEQGHDLICCRDPGGTPAGDEIRRLLLESRSEMSVLCEMLLYQASRSELVRQIIRPALEAGKTVLSDRFLLATIVYQGYAGGLDIETIRNVGLIATGGVLPDWTGVLDIEIEAAADRLSGRLAVADRMERKGSAFHEKVRMGFLAEARRSNDRISIIDASGSPDDVHKQVVKEVRCVLGTLSRP